MAGARAAACCSDLQAIIPIAGRSSTDDVRAGMDEVRTDASYSFLDPRVAEGAVPMDAVATSLAPQPLAREQPRTEEE